MDVLVWFGGGGSLGAFDAGVWQALVPRLHASKARVVAVGGASIGAVNAAFLAHPVTGGGSVPGVLDAVWRSELATASVPFNGPLAWLGDRSARSWNGVLTGLLVGNRRLYRTEAGHWNPLHGLERPMHPLMDRRRQWAWLRDRLGDIPARRGAAPWLCAAAVDVLSGELALFDNGTGALDVAALAAASAIPLMFEPVEIDGRLYWDGEMTRESALPSYVARAKALGVLDGSGPTLLIAVDHMSRALLRPPASDVEIADRMLELLLYGKARVEPAMLDGIDQVLAIEREPMPHDAISGQFDYSPERIDELIAQGARQAARSWDTAFPETAPPPAATIAD